MHVSLCFAPPPSLKVSLMSIYWCSQELSVSWLSPCSTVSCFINYVYLCVMKYECMSPLFLSTTYQVSQFCIAVGWNIDVCPFLEPWIQNVIYLLQGKLSVLPKYQGLYVVFWLMKGFSFKYTVHHQTRWIHESLETSANSLKELSLGKLEHLCFFFLKKTKINF